MYGNGLAAYGERIIRNRNLPTHIQKDCWKGRICGQEQIHCGLSVGARGAAPNGSLAAPAATGTLLTIGMTISVFELYSPPLREPASSTLVLCHSEAVIFPNFCRICHRSDVNLAHIIILKRDKQLMMIPVYLSWTSARWWAAPIAAARST